MSLDCAPKRKKYLLAVDLDGTFLGGSDEEKLELYELLSKESSKFCLVFVTGRGLESMLSLLADPFIPSPDYIIADIGATIVTGDDLIPVQPLQAEIEECWPGTSEVLDQLNHFKQLKRQETPQERRCSFYVAPAQKEQAIDTVVREMGCDSIYSCDRYLDVVPAGVNKGSSLRKLIEMENLAPAKIIVAGDTMNDLSLFELAEVNGIVVGLAEQTLVETVRSKSGIYIAEKPGAGGILEGLAKFNILDRETPRPIVNGDDEHSSRQLVIVYHRPPFDEQVTTGGEILRRPHKSPNGIIPTLLGLFAEKYRGHWVSWSKQSSRKVVDFDEHVYIDREKYPGLTANRIALTDNDIQRFYEEFSKEAFWPVIFSFPDKAEFSEHQWQHYCEINRIFAERVARDAAPHALVWIHDYNLWMVPHFLRRLRPDVKMFFFHHTAFPPSDVFNVIPWSRDIVVSLIQCDEVCFHIPRYAENFADVVRSHMPVHVLQQQSCAPRFLTYGCALGISEMTTSIEVMDRKVSISANPVGINNKLIEQVLTGAKCHTLLDGVLGEVGKGIFVLSVERLDYVKGPIEKLLAFERLLETHPETQGRVTLLNIITPAAKDMTVYDEIRKDVDRMVGRINGRFSKFNWTPVRYFFRAFPFEEILALYAAADIAWITPLRDGLNLVAKEYVAAKAVTDTPGILVLSEFAGAAVELHGALLTNPYDINDMTDTLHQAIIIDANEKRERLRRMVDIVRNNDVQNWVSACLGEEI
ncbi:glucosylglycerol-phosphate synthase [Candidatus Zixiibacteriota bacterium]